MEEELAETNREMDSESFERAQDEPDEAVAQWDTFGLDQRILAGIGTL